MTKKTSMPREFALKSYIIAVIVNGLVSGAHLVNGKGVGENFFYTFDTYVFMAKVYGYCLMVSTIFFAGIYFIIYLMALLYDRMNREKLFWLIFAVGLSLTVAVYSLFREVWHIYTTDMEVLAAIAAFSILVSLSSQYQLLKDFVHGEELLNLHET